MKRPHIPIKIKLAVLERQVFIDKAYRNDAEREFIYDWYQACCATHPTSYRVKWLLHRLFHGMPAELDHDPALVFRRKNHKTGGYRPDANDPKYLVYRLKPDHRRKTFGRKPDAKRTVTTKGSDVWLAKKFRKLEKPKRPKQKIPSRPFQKRSLSAKRAGKGS